MKLPMIIQGGMGIGISNWRLARAVSLQGQLGVVSGTALDMVLARRLQDGDPGGDMRRALASFPNLTWSQEVLKKYFVEGGITRDASYKPVPMYRIRPAESLVKLTVLANFAEVFLAKEGHTGMVGVNYLEKLQLPTLPSLFGAMLAGVDYVLIGAGIPKYIPGVLDQLADWLPTQLKIDVRGFAAVEDIFTHFDPNRWDIPKRKLPRPTFLAIVASDVLATSLARRSNGQVDGFIVEGPTAGGHNAPPRGALKLTETGEPIYGPRDEPSLENMRRLNLPFWLAGSYGHPGKLQEALLAGAAGVQVGTAFAFCDESGMEQDLKQCVLRSVSEDKIRISTDPDASPTGFPFKMVQIEGTLSEEGAYHQRQRVCDMGYLREIYRKQDATIGYRCPGEPVDDYVRKGGTLEATTNRRCVCNGLAATMGVAQRRAGVPEKFLVTAGNDLSSLKTFMRAGCLNYSARDVIQRLLGAD
jgi:nitronate monooxygenase